MLWKRSKRGAFFFGESLDASGLSLCLSSRLFPRNSSLFNGLYSALFAFSYQPSVPRLRSSLCSHSFFPSAHPPTPLSLAFFFDLLRRRIFLSLSIFLSLLLFSHSLSLSPFRIFRFLHNLLPNGVPYGGHCRSSCSLLPERRVVFRFGRRRSSLRWHGLGAFSIIGRVLPNPEKRSREFTTTCPTADGNLDARGM